MKKYFSIVLLVLLNKFYLQAQESSDTTAFKSQLNNQGVQMSPLSNPGWQLDIGSGDLQLQSLYAGTNGHGGDRLFRIFTSVGSPISFSAYNFYNSKLITDIGINYSINGDNALQQFARIGTKKSPYIRLNAEEGSVSLFGEEGAGGDFRIISSRLGIHVKKNGAVGIGTTNVPAEARMAVEGKLYAREVNVNADTWSDYVFDKSYNLMPLEKVEEFIKQNKHLPDVPSEAEVMRDGINVSQMNATLLRKIEELTLHLIAKDKDIELLKQQVAELYQQKTNSTTEK